MARTIDTRTLFQQGYTVEPNPLCPTAFHVFTPDCGQRYSVDVRAITCECDAFRFGQHRGELCKHLCGISLLVTEQIADYYRQQRRFAEVDRAARTNREREGAKQAGEACIRLATELEWLQEDLNLVVVERSAERAKAA